jgi:hypothetical protein
MPLTKQAFNEDDDSGLDDDTRAAAQLTALTEVNTQLALRQFYSLTNTEHASAEPIASDALMMIDPAAWRFIMMSIALSC